MLICFKFININITNLSKIIEIVMIPNQTSQQQTNIFATPPSKKLGSPKSISRKPSFINFTKKKPVEISSIRSSDRIRFISPTKANLYLNDQSQLVKQSFDFNYTQYCEKQPINYPFIKKCVSPRLFDDISFTRNKSLNISFHQQNSFMNTILSPSIQDFNNCDDNVSQIYDPTSKKLQQQIQSLKKLNFDLNILLDQKNEQIQKQKLDYDAKLTQLSQQLLQIKNNIQSSEHRLEETENKLAKSENRCKELEAKYKEVQVKLVDANEKLDKANKQIKMYKAKYRTNFNNVPKQNDDTKSKKYHQNCCKKGENHHHIHTQKGAKVNQNNCNKLNTLAQSRKFTNSNQNSSSIQLKKIKSQTILPQYTSFDLSTNQISNKLMKIHSNQQEFNSYSELKIEIQNLSNEIRYKDIEILTLKKAKCQYEREKSNYQKVKRFNKKLLARVQFLTKQCDDMQNNSKRMSLPSQVTPKKKFKQQYEDFDEDQQQQQNLQLFQLSPQKHFHEASTQNTDIIIEQFDSR